MAQNTEKDQVESLNRQLIIEKANEIFREFKERLKEQEENNVLEALAKFGERNSLKYVSKIWFFMSFACILAAAIIAVLLLMNPGDPRISSLSFLIAMFGLIFVLFFSIASVIIELKTSTEILNGIRFSKVFQADQKKIEASLSRLQVHEKIDTDWISMRITLMLYGFLASNLSYLIQKEEKSRGFFNAFAPMLLVIVVAVAIATAGTLSIFSFQTLTAILTVGYILINHVGYNRRILKYYKIISILEKTKLEKLSCFFIEDETSFDLSA